MRKTLALLLAAGFLYLVPSPPRSIKSQTLVCVQQVPNGRQSYTQPLYRRAGDHRP